MKKFTSIILALLVICSLFTMSACSDNQGNSGTTTTTTTEVKVETMTLVVGTEIPVSYTVELNKIETGKGIMPVLEYLKAEKGLEYASDDTGYGAFLTKVGALEQGDNTYIYLYTSVEKDKDVSQYATIVEFEGKTLCSSGVGASEMTIEDGCIIYVGTVQF